MSEREIPPIELDQTEISNYMLRRDSKVIKTVEISDETTGEVYGYKVWYENSKGQQLRLVLTRGR